MNTFTIEKLVRMQHCDAAGVIFTPQYFNLFTEVLEDWFGLALGHSFAHIVSDTRAGVPAMKVVAKFMKPSYLGDRLLYSVNVKRLRRNTVLVRMNATCGDERRCLGDFLLGHATLASKTLADWPPALHAKMREFAPD